MKYLLLIAISFLTSVDPATIRKINAAKLAAEDAFKRGDYGSAIQHYQYLVDSLGVKEEEVMINLANSYYLQKDTANALNTYQALTGSLKTDINSKAHQQLGIMANQQGRAEEALNYFKQAIKAEPSNDGARYNYEMLKKKLNEKKKQEEEKKQQNKDQNKKDPQNKDQKNKEDQKKEQEEKDQQNKEEQKKDQEKKGQEKEQEQKEQQDKEKQKKKQEEQAKKEADKKDFQNIDREKLKEMNISEEKARMILEAMKNQEKQYLQQQKRKSTQSRDRNKPDW